MPRDPKIVDEEIEANKTEEQKQQDQLDKIQGGVLVGGAVACAVGVGSMFKGAAVVGMLSGIGGMLSGIGKFFGCTSRE